MDLAYGEKYETFRAEVREFLADHAHRAPREMGNSPAVRDWQQRLLEHGYAGRTVPRIYGGYGADPDILEARILGEEFARARVFPGIKGQGVSMLIPTLLEVGTEEQRRRWIPPTVRGDILWCQGYSEPDAGSDLASLRTHARVEDDCFVVNGQKIWTSGAHYADMMFCLVRTEPDAPKHDGISYLLIPVDSPGIEVRPLRQMTGKSGFNEVFFTEVRVPVDQIVGRRGEGWRVANITLRHERTMLGDPDQLLSRLNALIELMRTETVDGQAVIDHPVFRDRLLKIQARVMAMRANDWRLLSSSLNGDEDPVLARMVVKLQGTELRHALEGLAIDALGDIGILYEGSPELRDEGMWQTHYMYYLGLIIGGGTSQIQKNIIGERGLGLPKEPKIVPPGGGL